MKRINLILLLSILVFTNFRCNYDDVSYHHMVCDSDILSLNLEIKSDSMYFYDMKYINNEFDWNQVKFTYNSGFGYISGNSNKKSVKLRSIDFYNIDNTIITNSKESMKSILVDIFQRRIEGNVNYPKKIDYKFLFDGKNEVATVKGVKKLNTDIDINYNKSTGTLHIGEDIYSKFEYAETEDDIIIKQIDKLIDDKDVYIMSLIKLEE